MERKENPANNRKVIFFLNDQSLPVDHIFQVKDIINDIENLVKAGKVQFKNTICSASHIVHGTVDHLKDKGCIEKVNIEADGLYRVLVPSSTW